jgi:hypothetical protein
MCKWLTLVGRRRPAADGETDQRGWAGLTAGGWIMYVSIELLVAANLCGGPKERTLAIYTQYYLHPLSVSVRVRESRTERGENEQEIDGD